MSPQPSLRRRPGLSPSSHLGVSLALLLALAGVWGLYIGGAAYCGDSAALCVCVVACQVLCACVG